MSGQRTELTALVLGAAAGGGFPQWNCACRQCAWARAGDHRVRPASQASLAVSADDETWLIVGASPDLRQQIGATPRLWPRGSGRDSPIAGVFLLGGDVDAIAGLLVLRERQPFTIYAPQPVLAMLATNRLFDVLDPDLVRRVEVPPDEPVGCGNGLRVSLVPMPGKVPLYLESRGATGPEPGPNFAACVQANGRRVIVAPSCAEITDGVHKLLAGGEVVFFDGTVFTDNEMITAGLGTKTGRRMGHVPLSGPDGTLARLADLPGRRILFHINNSNPILVAGSPERREVEAAGFEVAYDGMEVRL
jgi:pyrroloquinoline quinone biosynthesis protein B